MNEASMLTAADWLLRAAFVGGIAYALRTTQRERTRAREDAIIALQQRLMELLPLPHLGDRGSLMGMLRDIAPDHDLSIYTAGEPVLLVTRRNPHEPPGAEEARWVEVHRAALSVGQVVYEPRCGTLVPLRLRNGHLAGALIIPTRKELTFDDVAQATLRHVAGLLFALNPARAGS